MNRNHSTRNPRHIPKSNARSLKNFEASLRQAVQALHLTSSALEKVIDFLQTHYLPLVLERNPVAEELKDSAVDTQASKTFRELTRRCKPELLVTPSTTSSSEEEMEDAKLCDDVPVPAIAHPLAFVDEREKSHHQVAPMRPKNTQTPQMDEITPRHAAKRTASELQDAVTHLPFSRRRRRRPLYTREDAKLEAASRAAEVQRQLAEDKDEGEAQ